jgi:phage gp29-like protein
VILDAYGAPLEQAVTQPPWADRYQRVVGSALDPGYISACLARADQGYFDALADLLGEVRGTDTHLQSVLGKRESAIAAAPWELRPPPGAGRRGDEIAKYCTEQLRAVEGDGDLAIDFADLLAELQGGVYHGRAVVENLWAQDGRWWYPRAFLPVHPRRLAMATNWALHIWDPVGGAFDAERGGGSSPFATFPGVPLAAFPRGKFIVHRPRTVPGAYPMRNGLGRVLVWFACFKKVGWRELMGLVEWAARGLRVGTYASGTSKDRPSPPNPEDKAVLDRALRTLSSAMAVSIPDTTSIEVHEAGAENTLSERLIRLCNAEMSKCVLGGDLSTESGVRGARSLGDTQRDDQLVLTRMDAAGDASTVKRDVLTPMVVMSFGESARRWVPDLVLQIEPPPDPEKQARVFGSFIEHGGHVTQRDYRNALSVPDPVPSDAKNAGKELDEDEGDELVVMPGAQPAADEGDDEAKPGEPDKKPAGRGDDEDDQDA